MRSLDDPANPYLGQYSEWDSWMYAHPGDPTFEERRAVFAGELPDNKFWGSVSVNADGYPIPDMLSRELRRQDDADGQPPPKDACNLGFGVWGEMPLEMYERWDAAGLAVDAQYAARIPKWLADNPPKSARIWPDGTVTTHGALGSDDGQGEYILLDQSSWKMTPEPFFLYSAGGGLITGDAINETELFPGDYDAADPLDALFFANWEGKMFARGKARGWDGAMIENDYYTWYSRDPWTLQEVYDYDGTRYGADINLYARDSNKFTSISGSELPKLYAAQQRLAAQP